VPIGSPADPAICSVMATSGTEVMRAGGLAILMAPVVLLAVRFQGLRSTFVRRLFIGVALTLGVSGVVALLIRSVAWATGSTFD
jgi:hypothetical protein